VPAPIRTCQEYFDTLPARYVATAGKGVTAVFQFELTGDGGGTWHVAVEDGKMSVVAGAHAAPTSTISAGAADYVKIANGEMNGLRAVMTRKMSVGGNLVMARRMQAMFPTG
jgi:putative sterol carrier protein